MTQPDAQTGPHIRMGRMFHRRRVWIRASIVGLLVVIGLGIGIPTVFSGAHVRPVPEVATASQPLGTSSASSVRVLVHVVGAVAHPGMIVMAPGARVIDAVLAAGGLTARADQCGINLARPIADGEQIIVPVTAANTGSCSLADGVTGGSASPGISGNKVSLSRATQAQLEQLPGVGPALASRIIDWRTAHGGFRQVRDLDNVSGIGARLLASLTPLVVP